MHELDERPASTAPRLADGVELIGEYEGSGYKDPPRLARLGSGQNVQMPALLYAVAEQIDGSRNFDQIAEAATRAAGRELRAEDVRLVIEEKLVPLGVVAAPDGSSVQVQKVDPLLALRFRVPVVSAENTRRVTSVFRPLFFTPVIIAALAGVVVFDVWLFGSHGIAQSVRQSLFHPGLVLALLGLVVLSAAFHEFGHAVACTYGGARPGAMGAGIYIAWPAFYTDVTDAYRLDKKGRLRTDLGGVYFNVVFILATAGVYFLTGWEFLLVVVAVEHLEIFHQLLPFIRLDGYYIVTDLTGVPDLFTRVKPILQSLIPGRESDRRVTELKRWARVVATLWVLIIVPVLMFNLGMLAYGFPRIAATAWESAHRQFGMLDHVGLLSAIVAVVQVFILAIPLVGIALTFALLARRLGVGIWNRTEHRPVARIAAVVAGIAMLFLVTRAVLPDGDNYRPIRRGERGTVSQLTAAVERTARGQAPIAPVGPPTRPAAPGPTPRGSTPSASDAPAPTTAPPEGGDAAVTTTSTEPTTTPEPAPTTTAAPATTTSLAPTTTVP